MSNKIINKALSIRQPFAELILQCKKRIEYRTVKTKRLNERFYIYASLTPGRPEAWKKLKLKPGDLPTGVLVGTVEIVECKGDVGNYRWILCSPVRLKRPIKPENKPQPVFFTPFK